MTPDSGPAFEALVHALSDPSAFPDSTADVECVQTHISAVFLTDTRAYKIKKPKDLGFLDFTSLDRRRHFCHEEVRLNRRLAPFVYEGVVPILREDGTPRVSEVVCEPWDPDPAGEIVEWAVRMLRLPSSRTLEALLGAAAVGEEEIERLAERLALFHAGAARGDAIARVGGWETVWRNDRENFEQMEAFVGTTISAQVMGRLSRVSATEIEARRALIERRTHEGVPADTHGDLRLEHIYLLPPGWPGTVAPGTSQVPARRAGEPERPNSSPSDAGAPEFVIIDCVEFNERMRWADPVADIAFPVMELEYLDRPDLASRFSRRYFQAAGDAQGVKLLPYYATYRDVVRGKIRSLQGVDDLLASEARARAVARATRHFLRALSRLSVPSDRPALVVIQGPPGVGKSTVARALAATEGAATGGFVWIDTDRVRKEIARAAEDAGSAYGEGIYTAEWTERTYAECARRARGVLWNGDRAVVEGSFRRDAYRTAMIRLADTLGARVVILDCTLEPEVARERLAMRPRGDSDADWSVHQRMRAEWEPPSPTTRAYVRELSVDGTEQTAISAARAILVEEGLA